MATAQSHVLLAIQDAEKAVGKDNAGDSKEALRFYEAAQRHLELAIKAPDANELKDGLRAVVAQKRTEYASRIAELSRHILTVSAQRPPLTFSAAAAQPTLSEVSSTPAAWAGAQGVLQQAMDYAKVARQADQEGFIHTAQLYYEAAAACSMNELRRMEAGPAVAKSLRESAAAYVGRAEVLAAFLDSPKGAEYIEAKIPEDSSLCRSLAAAPLLKPGAGADVVRAASRASSSPAKPAMVQSLSDGVGSPKISSPGHIVRGESRSSLFSRGTVELEVRLQTENLRPGSSWRAEVTVHNQSSGEVAGLRLQVVSILCVRGGARTETVVHEQRWAGAGVFPVPAGREVVFDLTAELPAQLKLSEQDDAFERSHSLVFSLEVPLLVRSLGVSIPIRVS